MTPLEYWWLVEMFKQRVQRQVGGIFGGVGKPAQSKNGANGHVPAELDGWSRELGGLNNNAEHEAQLAAGTKQPLEEWYVPAPE